MLIVVACFGNLLRGDDGAGVAVARALQELCPPEQVRVLDIGIGGVHLVQELLEPVDSLIVVDAVDLGRVPGSVVVVHPEVPDARAWTAGERSDQLTDMHYATPERAMLLARGLRILPERTVLVGVQVDRVADWSDRLTPAVAKAVGPAAAEVRRLVRAAGVPWT